MSAGGILSTSEFFQCFPNEDAARFCFEKRSWGSTLPTCGHCGSVDIRECKDHKPMPYRCRSCRKHFSVRTGTVLAESCLPLQKWLLAIYMLTSARKGIPSTQIARELGITQKSAWFLAQRIRETWLKDRDGDMGNHTQVDDTYIGGKASPTRECGTRLVSLSAIWRIPTASRVSGHCRSAATTASITS